MADVTSVLPMDGVVAPAQVTPTSTGGATSTGGTNSLGDLTSLIGGLGSLGTGLYSLLGGNTSLINQAQSIADPFASQRPQYQSMLQQLLTNPSSFNLSPAAKSQMTLGSENLARQGAAQGFLGSGNILAELQKYGQNVASQDYFNQINAITPLTGATTGNPAAAGAIMAALYGQQNDGLSNIGGGIQSLLGNSQVQSLLSGLPSGVSSLLTNLLGGSGQLADYAGTSGLGGLSDLFGGTTGSSGSSLTDLFGSGTADQVTQDLANSGLGDLSSSGLVDPSTYTDLASAASDFSF